MKDGYTASSRIPLCNKDRKIGPTISVEVPLEDERIDAIGKHVLRRKRLTLEGWLRPGWDALELLPRGLGRL